MSAHEMLGIVDLAGEPIGEQRDKADIHHLGLLHRDVHVWLTDGQNVLEQQRAWDKPIMPGTWDIAVGGHVGAGESYLSAAMRETEEELGLQFAPDRYKPAGRLAVSMLIEPGGWQHCTVGDNFVVVERGLALADLTLQEDEVIDARLYPIDRLEADLANPETALRHAPQPPELWALGIAAMRAAA
jgi:isopentenyl-diphosphate delta-isomerase